MTRWLARRGRIRTVFEAIVLLQLGHLGEHLVQIAQIHLLGWSPPEARGLVAAFDVERVHFLWNVGVLVAVGWLDRRGGPPAPFVVPFAWAAAHTAEHAYLVARATLTGLDGGAGILGHGGWLATLGVSIAGLTTWTRPTVHLVWNVGEVALLSVAYIAWAWARFSHWARRALPLVPSVGVSTLTVLVLALSGTRADQPITALASSEIILDGRNELVGIAVSPDGTRYISDRGAGLVYRLTAAGLLTIVVDSLDRPAGLAMMADGRLLIVEEHAGRVIRLEPNGTRTAIASGLKSPRWVVVHDDGSLYVTAHRWISPDGTDPTEGRVVVRIDDAGGTMSEVATGIRAAQGLARLNGSLIVASKGLSTGPESTGMLLRYPILPGGTLGAGTTWVATGLKQPVGLAVDVLEALYVASKELTIETDSAKRAIGKVHPSAQLSDFASNLSDPQGVALGPDGALYVADGKSGRLYRFRPPSAPVLGALPRFSRSALAALTVTAEAGARIDVFVNDAARATSGRADAAGQFTIDVPLDTNRSNELDVYATTHGGDGLTSPGASAQTLHDDRAPDVSFAALPPGAHLRAVVRLSCAVRDGGSGVARVSVSAAGRALSATLDPSPPAANLTASSDWDTSTALDGAQSVAVKATDVAGNESPIVIRSVIVDNTPPET